EDGAPLGLRHGLHQRVAERVALESLHGHRANLVGLPTIRRGRPHSNYADAVLGALVEDLAANSVLCRELVRRALERVQDLATLQRQELERCRARVEAGHLAPRTVVCDL